MSSLHQFADGIQRVHRGLEFLTPIIDLVVRLWVAAVFFRSGLVKLSSWDTTVLLFTNEYHVPFLSPEVAALAGTATELVVPVLLALGLGGRVAAAILFVFNIVAVISYPELEGLGLEQHYVWGILLAVTLLHGPGALSVDRLVARWVRRDAQRRATLAAA